MLRIFAFLIITPVILGAVKEHSEHLSSKNVPSKRIVGGTKAKDGQFPYQASLKYIKSGIHICAGAIVGTRSILTAAHCVDRGIPEDYLVLVGTIHLFKGGTEYHFSEIHVHQNFNKLTLDYDIAVLRTNRDITETRLVKIIPISGNTIPGDVECRVAGWGDKKYVRRSFSKNHLIRTTFLSFVTVRTISNRMCEVEIGSIDAQNVTPRKICTKGMDKFGPCVGDSGSPLVCQNEVVGIVSWGIGCANGIPDVYERVSVHREWLAANVR
ncbi:chymotrypsin-2-like [Phlebotomus papatasi]|uniref:chymotrypsin-2-like n=1 Tax=Phlebotomus papatasi TaxID=29031 RepID=UPI0024836F09|nr:chymotrypsin-2-like [Phlebotomus papatasi]